MRFRIRYKAGLGYYVQQKGWLFWGTLRRVCHSWGDSWTEVRYFHSEEKAREYIDRTVATQNERKKYFLGEQEKENSHQTVMIEK
jgi:hypothetical protein